VGKRLLKGYRGCRKEVEEVSSSDDKQEVVEVLGEEILRVINLKVLKPPQPLSITSL